MYLIFWNINVFIENRCISFEKFANNRYHNIYII